MDYLMCSSTAPVASEDGDFEARISSSEQAPGFLVESSCSEQSEFSSADKSARHRIPAPQEAFLEASKSGRTSPSSICVQRKLSTGIATTPDSKHPKLVGRPIVTVPNLGFNPISTPPSKQRMAVPRSAPPKAPKVPALGVQVPKPRTNKERSTSVYVTHSAANESAKLSSDETSDANESRPKLHRAASAPIKVDRARVFRNYPSPLRLEAWSEPASENYKIRGANYLKDGIKEHSMESAFRLLTVDLVQCDAPIYTGLCAHPNERVQQAMKRERETKIKELPPFIFAVNLCVPGGKPYHQVTYFGVDDIDSLEHPTTPFGRLMNEFIFGDSDDFRNKTFKLIPRIVEGNYIVRKAVGSKPSILGRKIKQYYIRGPNYFELIVDIASDPVAQRIVKLALGYAKTLVVDMMFVLEGAQEEFLPERIFGGVRMKNIDFREKDGKRRVENV